MKNRLTLFSLAMLCYGHMQAAGWFSNKWKQLDTTLKTYIPGPYSTLDNLPPEDAASRIAFMEHAFKTCPKQLKQDYLTNLNNQEKALNQNLDNFLKYYDLTAAVSIPESQNRYFGDRLYRDAIYKHTQALGALRRQQENFVRLIQQHKYEYAKPWSFWQYQYPDRFEY